MSTPTLANIATLAGDYPSTAERFSKREKKLASAVKTYVDSLSPDTIIAARGDMIVGDANDEGSALTVGTADQILVSDATDPSWSKLVNANVDASAAIAYSKLNLTGAVLNADLAGSIATSNLAGATHSADAVALLPKFVKVNCSSADLTGAGSGVGFACLGSTDIPDNAIIVGGFVDVVTTFAGDGDDSSTIAIHVNGADDIVAAVAIKTAADWDAGLKDIIPDATGSTAVKLTAARDVTVTWTAVATDTTLSAGEMNIYLQYIEGV